MKIRYLFLILVFTTILYGCGQDNKANVSESVKTNSSNKIKTYEECLAASGTEKENAYPEQCEKDGSTFINRDQKLTTEPMGKYNIKFETNYGDFEVELDGDKAPITVSNFLNYVNNKYFDGLIFHRIVKDFMVQGGGFDQDNVQKDTKKPIKNEADNGLKNEKYTIAMARTNEIDSATSQFFINTSDNDFLDHSSQNFGYAVFGKVVKGKDVIDKLNNVEVSESPMGEMSVPVKLAVIKKVYVVK